MLVIARKLGYPDLKAFRAAVVEDPKLRANSREQILDLYRKYIAQMKPQLPKLFGRLPKADCVVMPVEEFREKEAAGAQYEQGTPDGKRPGHVMVNTSDPTSRKTITMESTAYHEGVPGHHLQIAIAQELEDLPPVRRQAGYAAFVEGWALYSEKLGKEVGFYQDPYNDYGRLQDEMLRAIRLVVDTGFHYKKWTRQQVVDFFHDHSAIDEVEVQSETDRYISDPGQALAYKIGQLKILELRERAKAQLGARFDIRKFHDAVLDAGALPLDVLSARVDAWIASREGNGPGGRPVSAPPLAVEAAVAPGDGIFSRLEVCEDRRLRERGAHAGLDGLAQVVAALNGPTSRHENVHRDESPGARAAGADRVEEDAVLLKRGEGVGDRLPVLVGQGPVEQALPRLAHEPPAGPHDVDRDGKGDQGIQPHPPGQGDDRDSDDDPGRGPHVREQVVGVRSQGDRPQTVSRAQEGDGHRAVHRGCRRGDAHAEPGVRDRQGMPPAAQGRDRNPDGGGEDQKPFGATREVLRLRVAEGVPVVCGPGGEGQGPESDRRGDQIDSGLGRVREQTHRTGQAPRGDLERDRDDGRGDRQTGIEARSPGGASGHFRASRSSVSSAVA